MSDTPAYHGPQFTAPFAADTAKFLRVNFNTSGELAIGDASAACDGVNWMNDVDVSQDAFGTVRTRPAGTLIMITSKAVAAGALVYATAGGKVTDASGTPLEGRALSASSGDGGRIEVLPA